MKKIIAIGLVLAMVLSLASCGSIGKAYKIVGCYFFEPFSALHLDPEYKGSNIDEENPTVKKERENFTNVRVVIDVSDSGENGISEENTANAEGNIWYNDTRYDLSVAVEAPDCISSISKLEPHSSGRIYMSTLLPKEAENETNLEATVIINGKESKAKVTSYTAPDPTEGKKTLKTGESITVKNQKYNFTAEIAKCTKGALVTSDPNHSKQFMGKWSDLELLVTNNSKEELDCSDLRNNARFINAYIKATDTKYGEYQEAQLKGETESHDDFSDEGLKIQAGESAYIHFVATDATADNQFRFNCDSKCYLIDMS